MAKGPLYALFLSASRSEQHVDYGKALETLENIGVSWPQGWNPTPDFLKGK